jgi:hypothetical protein
MLAIDAGIYGLAADPFPIIFMDTRRPIPADKDAPSRLTIITVYFLPMIQRRTMAFANRTSCMSGEMLFLRHFALLVLVTISS